MKVEELTLVITAKATFMVTPDMFLHIQDVLDDIGMYSTIADVKLEVAERDDRE